MGNFSRQMIIASLVLALGITAFFVSFSSHQTRELYRNLHIIQKKRDDLDFEYQKLILERERLQIIQESRILQKNSKYAYSSDR